MKQFKFLFVFILFSICFASCSKDDGSIEGQETGQPETPSETILSPPDWIIGTWKSPLLGESHKFEFTENNFIFTQLTISYNFSEISKQQYYTVKEITNTGSAYQIDKTFYMVGTGQTLTDSFKFVKVSDNEVTFYVVGILNPIPYKLIKQ
ncbi:hypothetical protein [Dysgonomonas sp. ZJ279]|uniref:hypothetical protein n=1 Tax=Dysgonomonas sp. ZJ279 TaxID=2709796 RepID=UPI0013EC65FC|nr:hypothetical protein [Dysgonomonas sp. ZJ279]